MCFLVDLVMKCKGLLPTHLDPVNIENSAKDQSYNVKNLYCLHFKSLESNIFSHINQWQYFST